MKANWNLKKVWYCIERSFTHPGVKDNATITFLHYEGKFEYEKIWKVP